MRKHKKKCVMPLAFTEGKKIEREVSVERIIDDWLNDKSISVKESTLARYKAITDNHVSPMLENLKLSEITASVIQKYINSLIIRGYACKTVSDILVVTKNIFKYISARGIMHNCDLSAVNIRTKRVQTEILTLHEQKKLCLYLTENMNIKNFGILLSLYTGIRIGELCALKWGDIDMEEKSLKINKTMIRIHDNSSANSPVCTKIIITPPKSEDSIRIIPINSFLTEIIKELLDSENKYILTGSAEKYIEPRNMQYYFKSVLKRCGIRNVNFHALRHTFATRCVENGFEIKSLSEILGHSNVRITLERYVHSSMELKRKNMEKLSSI